MEAFVDITLVRTVLKVCELSFVQSTDMYSHSQNDDSSDF